MTAMWRWRRTATTTEIVLCDRSGTSHGRAASQNSLGAAVAHSKAISFGTQRPTQPPTRPSHTMR